jgi:hypothetical protein
VSADGESSYGPLFVVGAAAGGAMIVFGLISMFTVPSAGGLELALWLVGGAVVHDLVLAPAVLAAGWAVARFVPPGARGPAQTGLVVSAVLTAFALPFVLGFGERADNPSFLPRNYGAGLLVLLGLTWAAVVTWALVRRSRRDRAATGTGQDGR